MKRKLFLVCVVLSLLLLVFPACEMDAKGSVKSLTKPYIGEYECVEGHMGETDLLEKYEFIKITLIDDKKMEINFKPKNGTQHSFEGEYSVDGETREFTVKQESSAINSKKKSLSKTENSLLQK